MSLLLTESSAGRPSSTSAPLIDGVAEEGRILSASTGQWAGAPTSHAYQWHRCDPAGLGCVDVEGATGADYAVAAADVGSTLRVAVTAANDAGSAVAESAATVTVSAAISTAFHRYVTDGACSACSVSVLETGELRVAVAGGADPLDTAYGIADLGVGITGRLYVRDLIRLAEGQSLAANLAVLQVRDGTDSLVYELYVAPDGTLRLWSPSGGLRSTSINVSTGIVVPTNGVSGIRAEVAAERGSAVTVRVDGLVRVDLRGLTGARSGDQRFLRAGIDHYDGSSVNPVAVDHGAVAVSRVGWLGAPASGRAPENTAVPTVTGPALEGSLLTAEPGTWSTSVALGYGWRRCDALGTACAGVAGASGRSYRVSAADVGATLLVRVTATNGAGSTPVDSAATEVVQADASPVLTFERDEVDLGPFAQPTDTSNVGDLNGDGRPDSVVAGASFLAWYQNPDWSPRLIAEGGYGDGSGIAVRDLDDDGSQDVIVSENASEQMVWFANTPGGWVRRPLSGALCHNMDFADLNGDGREDIACADAWNKQVVWLEAPVNPTVPWTTRVIDPSRSVWGARIADIDRDGRPDVLSGRAWYRNTGGQAWPRYPYTGLSDSARPGDTFPGWYFDDHSYLTVLDLNEDGRLDVFATLFGGSPESEVWAFLAPSDPLTESWRAVQVDPGPLFSVHTQTRLGSSSIEVAVGEMAVGGYSFGVNPDPQIYVYSLSGPPDDPNSWRRTTVDLFGTHEAQAADVDGDGLVDLMGGQENYDLLVPPQTGGVFWWQNTTNVPPTPPQPVDLPAVVGLAREANLLRISRGSWTGTRPISYRYAWRRCDAAGGACVDIPGATGELSSPRIHAPGSPTSRPNRALSSAFS